MQTDYYYVTKENKHEYQHSADITVANISANSENVSNSHQFFSACNSKYFEPEMS